MNNITLPRELVEQVLSCEPTEYEKMYQLKKQLQSALSQQAPSQLKWCHHCGEGVTTFCRGSLNKCPLELNKIVAQGETK